MIVHLRTSKAPPTRDSIQYTIPSAKHIPIPSAKLTQATPAYPSTPSQSPPATSLHPPPSPHGVVSHSSPPAFHYRSPAHSSSTSGVRGAWLSSQHRCIWLERERADGEEHDRRRLVPKQGPVQLQVSVKEEKTRRRLAATHLALSREF